MKKILELGTYLLVLLLPWQTRLILHQGMINGNPSELLTISLYATDILLIGLSILTLSYFLLGIFLGTKSPIGDLFPKKFSFRPKKLFKNKRATSIYPFMEVKLLTIFLGLGAVSIFFAENRFLAVQRMGWILLAICLAILVAKCKEKTNIAFWFLMGLMLSAWLGIYQYILQNTFACKWLGLAEHDPKAGGTSIVEIYANNGNPTRWLRAYGSFDHPNVFGALMAIGIIFALWFFYEEVKENWKKILLYVALISFSSGFFMSLSRSAWVGLFLTLITLIIFIITKEQQNKFKNLLKALFLVGIIFATFAFAYPNQFLMRSGGQGRLEQKSLDDRAVYFEQGKGIIKNNLIFGVGIGNYIGALLKKNPKNDAWTYQPIHNVFLYIWAELGIVGLLLFVTMSVFTGILAWKSDPFVFAALVSLIPSFLLDHWLWDLHFGILLFGCMVGFAIGFPSKLNLDKLWKCD